MFVAVLWLPGCQDPSATTVSPAWMVLSPSSLSFSATAGDPDPDQKTVWVSNIGDGALDGLTVAVAYEAEADWLEASLDSDAAPAALTIRPRTGRVASGTHTATVSLTSSRAENSPQVVEVSFAVTPRLSPGESYTASGVTVTFDQVYYVRWSEGFASPVRAIAIDVSIQNGTGETLDYDPALRWGVITAANHETLTETRGGTPANTRYFANLSIPAGATIQDTRSFIPFHGSPTSFAFRGRPSFANAAEFELDFTLNDIRSP